MRPLLAILISASLLGGIYGYTEFAKHSRAIAPEFIIDFADEAYSISIRKTFDAAPDPIFGSASLEVRFKGEIIFESAEEIPADKEIVIRPVDGVEVGENEIYVTANRKSTEDALAVLQVEIRMDGILITSQTIASEPGLSGVSGAITFATRRKESTDDLDH